MSARRDMLGRRGRKPWDVKPLNGCDGCLDGTYHIFYCKRAAENDEIARRLSRESEQ